MGFILQCNINHLALIIISCGLVFHFTKNVHELVNEPYSWNKGNLLHVSRCLWYSVMVKRHRKALILGFHVTSQALLKSVSAMLVSLGCQIYANNSLFLQRPFSDYRSTISPTTRISRNKKSIKVPGIDLKVSQCSLSLLKA